MNLSYWEQETFFKNIDAVIIGSGIVGLNAAIHLKHLRPKWRIVIFEKGSIPSGASTKNAGFACFGSISELLDDLEHHSETEVLELVEMRWKGLLKLRSLLGDATIGYKPFGGFEIFNTDEKEIFEKCEAAIPFFNKRIGKIVGQKQVYTLESVSKFGFSKKVNHIIHNQAEGQIHTGNMLKALTQLALSRGIEIFNGISIQKIENTPSRVHLKTAQGWEINTSKVIVATNGFVRQLFPDLETKAVRNQVLITTPIPNLQLKGTFHYNKGYCYFRNINQRILLGGGRNLAFDIETTNEFGTTPLIQNYLKKMLQEIILPHQKIEIAQQWSGILGVGTQKRPIVEMINENVAVAVRLGGMGVAIGSFIGEQGANLIAQT